MFGQMSIEYFLVFVFLIATFIFFLGFSNEFKRISDISSALETNRAVAFTVGHAVNVIFAAANGTTALISIPVGYNISFQPRGIFATDQNNNSGSFATMTSNVTVNISATNVSDLTVVNQNGRVFING